MMMKSAGSGGAGCSLSGARAELCAAKAAGAESTAGRRRRGPLADFLAALATTAGRTDARVTGGLMREGR